MPVLDKSRRYLHRAYRVWRDVTLWLDIGLAKLPHRVRAMRRTCRQRLAAIMPAANYKWTRLLPSPLVLLGIATVALAFFLAFQRQPPQTTPSMTDNLAGANGSGTISIELASYAKPPPAAIEATPDTSQPETPETKTVGPADAATPPLSTGAVAEEMPSTREITPIVQTAEKPQTVASVFPGAGGESISLDNLPADSTPTIQRPSAVADTANTPSVPPSIQVDTIEAFPISLASDTDGIAVNVQGHDVTSQLVRIPSQAGSRVPVPPLIVTDNSNVNSRPVSVGIVTAEVTPDPVPVISIPSTSRSELPDAGENEITRYLRELDRIMATGRPGDATSALQRSWQLFASIGDSKTQVAAGCEFARRMLHLGHSGHAVLYLDAAVQAALDLNETESQQALARLGLCEARSGLGARANLRLSQMADDYLKTVTALHISRILQAQTQLRESQHAHEHAYRASKAIVELDVDLKRALRRHPRAG